MESRRTFFGKLCKSGAVLALAGAGSVRGYGQKPSENAIRLSLSKADKSAKLPKIGLGGVAIGDGMNVHSDADCRATLEAAWDAGVRYYDTSPWYGFGLSERRFGNFLYNQNREDFVLSTKVGRILHPDAGYKQPSDSIWMGKANFKHTYDYTGAGVRRSIEDSLQRMGLPYIDYVFIHDLDSDNKEIDWNEQFEVCKKGAFVELSKMRDEGIIRGWGLGVNQVEPIVRAIRESDPDIMMSAAQYNLLVHDKALNEMMPLAKERNVKIVVAGALGGGYLAGTPRFRYKESLVTDEIRSKRSTMQKIAQKYGVDLRTAAIQFALMPDAVVSVAVGAHKPLQIQQNVVSLESEIPSEFWSDLKSSGLINKNVQIGNI